MKKKHLYIWKLIYRCFFCNPDIELYWSLFENHSANLLLDNCVSHSRYFSDESGTLFFEK